MYLICNVISCLLQNAVPNVIQKKPREYKLRAFVGFLFLLVVFLVGFAYIFYYQQLSRVSLPIVFCISVSIPVYNYFCFRKPILREFGLRKKIV